MLSLRYADLSNVDLFYYIISKQSHLLISPPVSSTKSLSMESCQAHGGRYKFSETLIFALKAQNSSYARKYFHDLPDITGSYHSVLRKSSPYT